MPNPAKHRTAVVTVRLNQIHIDSFKMLPKGDSASSLVRALLEQFIDGKELPIHIRSLRPRLQQAAKAAATPVALPVKAKTTSNTNGTASSSSVAVPVAASASTPVQTP